MVLWELNGNPRHGIGSELRQRIVDAAVGGLIGFEDFRTTDALASRLAEAHTILKEVDEMGLPDTPDLASKIREALALPPDLEAAVELRQ